MENAQCAVSNDFMCIQYNTSRLLIRDHTYDDVFPISAKLQKSPRVQLGITVKAERDEGSVRPAPARFLGGGACQRVGNPGISGAQGSTDLCSLQQQIEDRLAQKREDKAHAVASEQRIQHLVCAPGRPLPSDARATEGLVADR